MADKCLAALDVPCTSGRVGGSTAPGRAAHPDGWLVDRADAGTTVPGVQVRDCPLWMTDEPATLAMVERAPRTGRDACDEPGRGMVG